MNQLALELFEKLQDMDFLDYTENSDNDIQELKNELEFLKENNCNIILNILENL